jgi:uncharacterized Zn-binding protein involved in type VI secretion
MPGAARQFLDTAGGGLILGPSAFTVFCEGSFLSLLGDIILTHGEPPHTTATARILSGSFTVLCEGNFPSIQAMSTVTCGHTVDTGSATVLIGI